jgi:anti-sigma B factor antagonist
MSLKVDRNSLDSGIEVLTVSGSLTLGRDAQHFEWTIGELVKNRQNRIVVDLSDVPFVDSAGIGILVGCHGTVAKSGGQLRLAGLTDRVLNVLRITKVDSVVVMDPSVAEAVRVLSSTA